jgi:hypothetical protein
MASSKKSLSQPQIEALLEGIHHKLVRAAADWIYSEVVEKSDTTRFYVVKRFRLSTIRSLYRRGLMSANSDDPRLLDGHYGNECSAWLREGNHPARPLVWTNSLGCELLSEKRLLPNKLGDNAGIVDLEAYRGNRNVSVSRIISSRPTRHPGEHRYEGRDIVIVDKELKRFHDWLQSKGEDPSVVLARKWIAEFELYAEEDEEDFREFKALTLSNAMYDPQAAAALRVINDFEEAVYPDPMLKRLQDWLQEKGNDPTAVLARWWLAEFETTQGENRPYSRLMPTLH